MPQSLFAKDNEQSLSRYYDSENDRSRRRNIFNKFQDLSPEARVAYQAQQAGLDPEAVRMGHQMGDIEMQMETAPYLGYTGPTDRELDMMRFDLGAPDSMTMRGQSVLRSVDGMTGDRSVEEYMMHNAPQAATYVDSLDHVTPSEDNAKISLYGSKGANPRTIAHEVAHARGAAEETPAYAAAVINAQTDGGFDQAVKRYANQYLEWDSLQHYEPKDLESAVLRDIQKNGFVRKLYQDEFERGGENPRAYGDNQGIMSMDSGLEYADPSEMYAENRFKSSIFGKRVADILGTRQTSLKSAQSTYLAQEGDDGFYQTQEETMLPLGLEESLDMEDAEDIMFEDEESSELDGLGSLMKTIVSSTSTSLEGFDYDMSETERKAQVREMAAMAQMLRKAGANITSEEDVEKLPPTILEQLNTILDRSPEE